MAPLSCVLLIVLSSRSALKATIIMFKLFIKLETLLAVIVMALLTSCSSTSNTINECENDKKEDLLPGLFSISENHQVRFSKGNLQYDKANKTFQFAKNQFDIIGIGNRKISSKENCLIDLFGWGTGDNPLLADTNDALYSRFVDWYRWGGKTKDENVTQWRTLSMDEWDYLLMERDSSDSKYGLGVVSGTFGIILLPDRFQMPEKLTFTNKTINFYSFSEWREMENAGAVFFPSGGYRVGTNVYDDGKYGYYWTSTSMEGNVMGINAYYVLLNPYNYYIGNHHRSCGFSVRLVQDTH